MAQPTDLSVYWAVFGERLLTKTVWLRDPGDSGNGIPVVLQEVDAGENNEVLKAMGAVPSEEEKRGAALTETLVQAVQSFNGMDLPADMAARRQIISHWPRVVVVALNRANNEFQDQIEAAREVVYSDPKTLGAPDGPLSAPVAAGPDSRLVA